MLLEQNRLDLGEKVIMDTNVEKLGRDWMTSRPN